MSHSTYLNLHYHIIFSTKNRTPWMSESWRERLHSYLGGILRDLGCTAVQTGGTADHVHILAGLQATHRLCDVVKEIKRGSSEWVHTSLGVRKFAWQQGYGALTVGSSQVPVILAYIQNQPQHHRSKTFQEELLEFLRENGIEYDERYA